MGIGINHIPERRVSTVYGFPGAAVTNHHKLGGFKQQKCIRSQFWRLKVQIQGVGRAMLPLWVLGEGASLPLPAPGSCRHPCFVAVSLQSLPASHDRLPSVSHTLSSPTDISHVGIWAHHAPGYPHLNSTSATTVSK